MASLHDVAKLAGVSKSTVSRVINNEYGVKKSTKIKVEKAVQECGYVVNQVAKDLKSQKTNLVGVIVPRMASNATAQGVDGLSAVFERSNKHVLLANSQREHRKEVEFIHLFNQKRVEGILLYATHLDDDIVNAITQSRAPVVLVGQDGSLHNIPSVIHDDLRVGFEAGTRLIKAGCQHVGFIGVDNNDIAVDGLRSQGLAQALERDGKSVECHYHGDFSIESGYLQMRRMLNEHSTVDGVFAATDRMALGAIKAIQEYNKTVGKEIKILGVGNDELAKIAVPGLSTFNYTFDYAGESAASLLLELIEGKKNVMSKLVLGFQFVERETC
ncbi:LacI family DNA-binding transcriptional regulator [Vibrio genomosp. F10]|uniref:Transcriptional regulator n=1 Tax=Vibrio genomosp. F10 TaxID=723171 RepID=A0A1B9QUY5_9VIBR|nr:LacI family DNA-binding transcriptional regulator [Vibrio genomosp. F10]OCH72049.1 transcriptional regulator [Vibrio genomosp. F10]OEE97373.1 transcriptional regulator [Vibrio genomosp. F10 str. 9ZC157]